MKMFSLEKQGFDKKNINSYGNMFLIGNGHIGYRGTLEEYSKNELVGLNIVGFYDQYKKLWRESVNAPNPFKVLICDDINTYSVLENEPLNHKVSLDIKHAIFNRETIFEDLVIKSERFIPFNEDNIIVFKYTIKSNVDKTIHVSMGLDTDIFEINGPHFKKIKVSNRGKEITFKGKTNEKKLLYEKAKYIFDSKEYSFDNGFYNFSLNLEENKSYTFYCCAKLFENTKPVKFKFNKKIYSNLRKNQIVDFDNKWENAFLEIKGNPRAQFAINYSIYHMLILGNKNYVTSIPARGVSGSVYKGAIFWDTEIFMVPFFSLTDKDVARSLLKYRINTAIGALRKAKEYGYKGIFYAWESQEDGRDACSLYNVTDPITGKPIRTYFNEKQIHIDADIVYAIENYMNATNDYSLLEEGALKVMNAISRFYMSYSKFRDGKYHLDDVIGPDEYHERINDNAFTSYMAKFAITTNIKYLEDSDPFKSVLKDYLIKLYVPEINNDGLIEQFGGYFNKEDTTVDNVRSRLRCPQDYWGGKNGVATSTRVIKQADVIALLVLLHNQFNNQILKANFDFYYPYTEHGSSLSSSMYSIIASKLGYTDISYQMFLKSAEIDLGVEQKMYAGGIYIGGTHPASNAGAYLSLIYGMAGLELKNDGFVINPHLPKEIKGLKFRFNFKNKTYIVNIDEDNLYNVMEVRS